MTSKSNSTAIHRAAGGGHLETIKWLYEHGANVDGATRRGQTALHLAARSGHFEVCRWLVEVAGK